MWMLPQTEKLACPIVSNVIFMSIRSYTFQIFLHFSNFHSPQKLELDEVCSAILLTKLFYYFSLFHMWLTTQYILIKLMYFFFSPVPLCLDIGEVSWLTASVSLLSKTPCQRKTLVFVSRDHIFILINEIHQLRLLEVN